MPFLTRYLGATALLAGVGATIAIWPRTRYEVIAETASTGPVVREIVAQSALQATATIDVAAQVSGEVQSLDVDEQTAVRTGDIMARIDPTPFEQALQGARSTLEYLEDDENTPPSRIADARRAVREAERDLERTIIRAPADGMVVLRNVSVGQIVSGSGSSPVLYRIATDLRHLELDFDIAPGEAGELHPGSDVVLSADGRDGAERHGTVEHVGSTTVVDVPNSDLLLRPGTLVTATIVLERHDNVIRVPSEALTFTPPEESASIVDANAADVRTNGAIGDGMFELWRYQRGRLTPVAVRVGLSGDGWTEIDSGLDDGDEIATGVVARRASMLSTIWTP